MVSLDKKSRSERDVANLDHLLWQCDELTIRLRESQSTSQELLTTTIHHLLDPRFVP